MSVHFYRTRHSHYCTLLLSIIIITLIFISQFNVVFGHYDADCRENIIAFF